MTSMTSATVRTSISRQCARPSGASSGALTTTSGSSRRCRRRASRQQAVAGDDEAGDDQRHAPEHLGVHRHVGEAKAHVAPHPVHRQVQDTPAVTATQPATKATRWRRSARIVRWRPSRRSMFIERAGGQGSTTASRRAWPRKRARRAGAPPARRADSAGSGPESGRSRPALRGAPAPCRRTGGCPSRTRRGGSACARRRAGRGPRRSPGRGSRADAERHLRARRERDAADLGRARRDPVAELVRALEAQELLDRAPDELRLGEQPRLLVGPVEQHAEAVADQVGRRLVAGVEQEDAVVQQLGRASASPPSPGISRVSTSPRGRPGGAGGRSTRPRGRQEVAHRAVAALELPGEHRLERAEDRERPAAQRRALLVRHAEQVADDLDRDRAAKSAIRSTAAAAPPSRRAGGRPASTRRGSIAAMWRGVSAPAIRRRTRVCSGGSLKTRLVVWCSNSGESPYFGRELLVLVGAESAASL